MTKVDKFAKFADTSAVRLNLKRKSVRGVFFMVGGGGTDLVVRLISTFLLARLLSPTDFGLVAMVVSVTAIAEQFAELGLSTATVQCRELSHQQVTNLFWINVGAGCLFSVAICGLAPVIAGFYATPELVTMTLVISTTFIWGGLTVQHQALLSRQLKQSHMAFVRVTASFLSLALTVLLAAYHFGVWALAWREVSRAFFVAAGMWLFCPWLPGWPRSGVGTRSLLRYGSHLTLGQLVTACVGQLDRLIIGRFFGAGPLGLYRQAQQLILAPIEQIRLPLISVASPSLSILQADAGRYRRYYQRIVLVIGLVTMPTGIFIAIYAHEITHVLLGQKWIAATLFLRIFGLITAVKPCLDTTALVMLTTGLSKRLLKLSVVYNALLAACMLAGAYWGVNGVALSNFIAVALMAVPMLYLSLRETPVSVTAFFGAVSTPAVGSGLMAIVVLTMRGFIFHYGMVVSLFGGLSVAIAVFVAVVFMLPIGRREIVGLISAVFGSFIHRETTAVSVNEAEEVEVG
jgi:PST family polysaccharide transporter